MHKGYLTTASVLGCLAVVLGAFGAHALKATLTPEALHTFEVGVRYQFYHVFALAITGILYAQLPGQLLRIAGVFFIAGILLFSGSLYLLTCLSAMQVIGYRAIGAITPVGGLFFMAGWTCLAIGSSRTLRGKL